MGSICECMEKEDDEGVKGEEVEEGAPRLETGEEESPAPEEAMCMERGERIWLPGVVFGVN